MMSLHVTATWALPSSLPSHRHTQQIHLEYRIKKQNKCPIELLSRGPKLRCLSFRPTGKAFFDIRQGQTQGWVRATARRQPQRHHTVYITVTVYTCPQTFRARHFHSPSLRAGIAHLSQQPRTVRCETKRFPGLTAIFTPGLPAGFSHAAGRSATCSAIPLIAVLCCSTDPLRLHWKSCWSHDTPKAT